MNFQRQWLVSLRAFDNPNPKTIPAKHTTKADQILKTWDKYVKPISWSSDGDYEDFFEQAARLHAAVQSFGAENIFLTLDNSDTAYNLVTRGEVSVSKLMRTGTPIYGIVFQNVALDHPLLKESHKADNYASTKTFHNNAGRDNELCGFNPDKGGKDILDVLVTFSHTGITEIVLKATQAKKGLWFFNIPADSKTSEVQEILMDELDWSLIRLEGLTNGFLAQQKIVMEYEYRVFVVNQQLVTGAGCVEEFTPLNNEAIFDVKVRKNRKEVSEVEANPEVVKTLVEFSNRMVKSFAEEEPDLMNYALDVALDSKGKPLIIERNALPNAGLYACNIQAITDAFAN